VDHPHFGYNTKLTKKALILTWFGIFFEVYLPLLGWDYFQILYLIFISGWYIQMDTLTPNQGFFGWQILPLGEKKSKACKLSKAFSGNKRALSCHISRGRGVEKLNSPYGGVNNFFLFSWNSSQIWLSPLVNDCQSTFLTKLSTFLG
jgi:hypothetical protein